MYSRISKNKFKLYMSMLVLRFGWTVELDDSKVLYGNSEILEINIKYVNDKTSTYKRFSKPRIPKINTG